MNKVLDILKKICYNVYKFIVDCISWVIGNVHTSLEIATLLTIIFVAFNFTLLSKFWLIVMIAVVGILVYNLVKK